MANKHYAPAEGGRHLEEVRASDFAADGVDVLRVELPNGDTHYVDSGDIDFRWEVSAGGSLELVNAERGGRRTLRSYGSWLYAEMVPFSRRPATQRTASVS
jgi:hypothetical protein